MIQASKTVSPLSGVQLIIEKLGAVGHMGQTLDERSL